MSQVKAAFQHIWIFLFFSVGFLSSTGCFDLPVPLTYAPQNPLATATPGAVPTGAPDGKGRALVVLTRSAPTAHYLSAEGEARGFEVELSRKFAEYLGRPVIFKAFESSQEVLAALRRGEGDWAAAGLSLGQALSENFVFGPVYHETPIYLACRVYFTLTSLTDLRKDLVVSTQTVHAELLGDAYGADLAFRVSPRSPEDLLQDVVAGNADCTMTGAHVLAMQSTGLRKLKIVHEWPERDRLAWVFPAERTYLRDASEGWFEKIRLNGELRSVADAHFGHAGEFDSYDVGRFVRRIRTRLPKYLPLFQKAAEETGLEWDLLAAVSYQESHWNPRAKSPTGVRGLMMLTLKTARGMGISNRLDPEQSVRGGARYLKRMLRQLPAYLKSDDRLWLALAAYNIGFGHLQDARSLAVWKGLNPNTWHDVQDTLPLLAHASYLPRLRHGAARGYEPVDYVRRVRNYLKILRARQEQLTPLAGAAVGTPAE